MTDHLFPDDPYVVVPELDNPATSPGRRITLRNHQALADGHHPANGLPINPDHRCGDCRHLDTNARNRVTFHKCPFHRYGRSHSAASDMRTSWPACPHWVAQR